MGRIAVSISHEAEYAVAVAFGVRTAGGRYVFPLDIEERLDDRERKLLAGSSGCSDLHAGGRGPLAARRATTTRPIDDDGAGGRSGSGGRG